MLRSLKLDGLRLSLTRSVCGSYRSPADQAKTRRGAFLNFPHIALALCPFSPPRRRGQVRLPLLGSNVCCGGNSLHLQLMTFLIDYTFVLAFNPAALCSHVSCTVIGILPFLPGELRLATTRLLGVPLGACIAISTFICSISSQTVGAKG